MGTSLQPPFKMTSAAKKAIDKSKELGLRITSTYRTPSESVRVGGTATDYHTKGQALDVAGSVTNMDKFAKWAKSSGLFRSVLWQVEGHYNHVHVSWNLDGSEKIAPTTTNPTNTTNPTYVVKPGDTLSEIGAMFGVAYKKIAERNNISNPDKIYVGQKLQIPVFF